MGGFKSLLPKTSSAVSNKTKAVNKIKIKKPKNASVKIGDTKIDMKGLSRRQRNKTLDAALTKMNGKNQLVNNAIKNLTNLANSTQATMVTLEGIGASKENNKMVAINKSLNDFISLLGDLSEEQLNALAPILTKMGKPNSAPKENSNNIDKNAGTIII